MKAEDFLDQEIEPAGEKITPRGMSAEAFLDMPVEEPIGEPAAAGPAFVQDQPPTILERGKEAVAGFFRPSFAPEPEEDWRRAAEPTIPRRELRADGTEEGPGFLGPLQRPDGKISTELSIGVNLDGEETEIPCLVPTLEQNEVDYLLGGGKPTEAIVQKAVDHARIRIGEGESPFAQAKPATAGLTPEEITLGRPISTITGKPIPTPEERMLGGITEPGKFDFMDRAREIKEEGIVPFVPFVSGAKEVKDIARVSAAAYKLKEGTASPEEKADLLEFVEKANRDTTFGYKVINTVAAMPAFMGEFLLTSGLYTAGRKVGTKAATKTLENYLGGAGRKLLEKDLGKIGIGIAGGVAGGTLQAPIMGAPRIVSGTIERSMPKLKLSRDEEGGINAVIAGEGEDFLVASTMALGDQWAETVSEHSGGLFRMLNGSAKNAAIRAGLFSATMKANPGMSPNQVNTLFNKMAYHGVINEMLEERVGEGLRAGLGLQEYKIPTAEQLAVELVSFSVPGVIQALGARAFRGPEPMEVPPVPPVPSAAPDLSETQRELAREAIREKIEEYAPEDIEAIYARATERAAYEPAAPPTPEEIEYEAYEPGIPGVEPAAPEVRIRKAPPTYPPGAEYVAGRPAPEELEVEYKPILGSHGLPWKEKERALKAFGSKRLKDMGVTEETHEIVPVKNGFGIARKTEGIVEPEVVPEVEKPKVEIPPVEKLLAEIPEFKNTEEALAFGKTATPEQIGALKAKKDESQSRSDALKEKGDMQGVMDEAVKGQLFREAIESAEGKIAPAPPKKPKEPVVKVSEKPAEPSMSQELKELHDHRARTLGFEKAGKSFVEGYLKRLARVAEKIDMTVVMSAYEALSEYQKGNISQAFLDAEKILGKLHKAEKEALLRKPKVEPKIEPKVEPKVKPKVKPERPEKITAETIRAKLPEASRKLSVDKLTGKDLEGAAKALGIRRDIALTVLKEVEPKASIVNFLSSKKKAGVDYEMEITVAETGETVTVKKDAAVALRETKKELSRYEKFLECLK